jgi:hypothetical protein
VRVPVLVLVVLAASSATVQADVIHLANGRNFEGQIVRRDARMTTIEVEGGRLSIPNDEIARIEDRSAPHEEFGELAATTDMSDAQQVESLSVWASSRGLSDHSRHLEEMAIGIRLESRVARAQERGRAQDFVDVFFWARAQHMSPLVQGWLLDQARAIDARLPGVRSAWNLYQEELRGDQQEAARVDRLRRERGSQRPSYRWSPEDERQLQIERQRRSRGDGEQRTSSDYRGSGQVERVASLEREVERQRGRIQELEEQVEDGPVGVVRRRRRGGSTRYVGPNAFAAPQPQGTRSCAAPQSTPAPNATPATPSRRGPAPIR